MNYYTLLAAKFAVIAILIYVCLRALTLLLECQQSFFPADIISALSPKKKRGRIFRTIIFSILFGALVVLMAFMSNHLNGHINIVMSYPEASNGLKPNGSRSNISDITSNEVLERALETNLLGDLSIEDLKEALTITPAWEEKDKKDSSGSTADRDLISAQSILKLECTKNTKDISGQLVVDTVAKAYKEWFIDNYGVNYSVLDINFDDLEDYDYPDYEDYFRTKINTLINFSSAYMGKDMSFVSPSTNESFYSLNTEAWNLHDTSLENLKSFIIENGLSKDADEYMNRTRYDYIANSKTYNNELLAYDTRIQASEKYANDMSTVVYIPTYETDNSFYMSKTKIGIDNFSDAANSHSSLASESLNIMLNQQYKMQQIHNSTANNVFYASADQQANDLKAAITALADKLHTTTVDYIDNSANGYILTYTDTIISILNIKHLAAIFIFVVVIYVVLSLKNLKKRLRKTRRAEA